MIDLGLHLDAAQFAREHLGFTPDARQAEVLDASIQRGLLNCTRQWGKSTVTAAKAIHRAFTDPGSLTVVVSPSVRQSREFLRKAKTFARRLGLPSRGDGDNEVSLALPNGSRLVGLPCLESTVRGFSAVALLLIDEASRVPDELYDAVRPMLATGNGDLWLMSTPMGKTGFFYREWAHGGEEWRRLRVPATECPRIDGKFLERERKSMSERVFAREYLCEFGEAEGQLFRESAIEALADEGTEPLFEPNDYFLRVTSIYPARYVIGLDLGQRQDHSAIAVLESRDVWTGETDYVTYAKVTRRVRSVRYLERVPLATSYEAVVERVRDLTRSLELAGRSVVVMDATGVGAPVVEMMRRAAQGCQLVPVVITGGDAETRSGSARRVPKQDLIAAMELAMESGELRVAASLRHLGALEDEMRAMEVTVGPSGREQFAATAAGTHDDLVMAVALACWWTGRKV